MSIRFVKELLAQWRTWLKWIVIIWFLYHFLLKPFIDFNQTMYENFGLIVTLIIDAVLVALYFKIFQSESSSTADPIPWYASPLLWVGIPVVAVIIYHFV